MNVHRSQRTRRIGPRSQCARSIRCDPMSARMPPPSARVCRHWIGVAGSTHRRVEVVHEDLPHRADLAGLDQLFQVARRRHPAVAVVHRVHTTGIPGHRGHPPRPVERQSQGLFAEHVLASLQRLDRDLLVRRVRRRDGDDVDVVARQHLSIIPIPFSNSGLIPGFVQRGLPPDRRSRRARPSRDARLLETPGCAATGPRCPSRSPLPAT